MSRKSWKISMARNRIVKNKIFFLLLISVCISLEAQTLRQGDLLALIEDIRQNLPGRDSYGYVEPTVSQQDSFNLIVNLILQNQYQKADSLARLSDYRLFEWTDTQNENKVNYVLMEPDADKSGGVKWGWGTYIFNPAGTCDVVIEVPHPWWDTNTWLVGFSAYRLLNANYYLMAGTHRYANGDNPAPADVAHNSENMFHVTHIAVMPLSLHALQVHGYSRNKPEYDGYPDIILSNGTANPSEILDSLATGFIQKSYSAGVFNGTNYVYLGATTNHQGQWCNSLGYSFIHMELEYYIRSSQAHWQNIINTLYDIFVIPTAITDGFSYSSTPHLDLRQNFPNPFNASTVIPFSLTEASDVELVIYDILGAKIWGWQGSNVPAGNHRIDFSGKSLNNIHLPAGNYFYNMKTAQSTITRKMIFLP